MLGDCANCNCNHMCFKKGKSCVNVEQKDILGLYTKEERKIMKAAAYVEATFYMKYTRLQETAEFAKKMGYHTIGLGFCMGIRDEAKLFAKFFTDRGFDVKSVCCKNCGINKDVLKLKKVRPDDAVEPMCNPKGQAQFLMTLSLREPATALSRRWSLRIVCLATIRFRSFIPAIGKVNWASIPDALSEKPAYLMCAGFFHRKKCVRIRVNPK